MQAEFDFVAGDARGERLALLDAVPIESGEVDDGLSTVKVSAATARSVLRAIEAHTRKSGRCWASSATIGHEISRHERTVRRAIRLLESMQFVVVDHQQGKSAVCRVNWGEISVKTRLPRKVSPFAHPGQFDTDPGHSDTDPGHCVRRSVSKRKKPFPPVSPPAIEDDWSVVSQSLRRLGVRSWRALLDELSKAGEIGPSDALAIIDHYERHPGAWTPVALVARLRAAHADTDPGDLWWTPLEGWKQAERIRESERDRASDRDAGAPPDWQVNIVIARKLRNAGLESCLTDDEQHAAGDWSESARHADIS
jgi:hypothetical protein